ncbi:MAG: hypothetical protein HYV26_16920 [Candidatus Hydrogenedentes bacterium]|nr:hypothetical protein [Candidatus Hydrogenedentota bacterium]
MKPREPGDSLREQEILPEPPPWYQRIIQEVAQESTEECARNLGESTANGLPSIECSQLDSELAGWEHLIRNPRVLRLIEEGRRKSSRVELALKTVLAEALKEYEKAREEYIADFHSPDFYRRRSPERNELQQYADPMMEFGRVQDVLMGGFYVLANLERADPDALATYMRIPKTRFDDTWQMEAWLIDAYFRQPEVSVARETSPFMLEHFRLVENVPVSEQVREHLESGTKPPLADQQIMVNSWNSPWPANFIMTAVAGVDTTNSEQLSIKLLPGYFEDMLDKKWAEAIKNNFLAFVDTFPE